MIINVYDNFDCHLENSRPFLTEADIKRGTAERELDPRGKQNINLRKIYSLSDNLKLLRCQSLVTLDESGNEGIISLQHSKHRQDLLEDHLNTG